MSAVENGLPLSALDRVARSVAPSDAKFAFRIIPRATLARRSKTSATTRDPADARLTAEEGNRLARLASVWAMALESELRAPCRGGHSGAVAIRLGGVTSQRLDRILRAYRIVDSGGAYPIFSAMGSKMWPGRWNTSAAPVIYAGEQYSTAMLEKLVHGNGRMPSDQYWIGITVPPGVSYEMFSPAHHPGWAAEDCRVAKAYGEAWQRSLLLIVPSVVARMERNILINAEHPELRHVTHSLHQPIWWNRRLCVA